MEKERFPSRGRGELPTKIMGRGQKRNSDRLRRPGRMEEADGQTDFDTSSYQGLPNPPERDRRDQSIVEEFRRSNILLGDSRLAGTDARSIRVMEDRQVQESGIWANPFFSLQHYDYDEIGNPIRSGKMPSFRVYANEPGVVYQIYQNKEPLQDGSGVLTEGNFLVPIHTSMCKTEYTIIDKILNQHSCNKQQPRPPLKIADAVSEFPFLGEERRRNVSWSSTVQNVDTNVTTDKADQGKVKVNQRRKTSSNSQPVPFPPPTQEWPRMVSWSPTLEQELEAGKTPERPKTAEKSASSQERTRTLSPPPAGSEPDPSMIETKKIIRRIKEERQRELYSCVGINPTDSMNNKIAKLAQSSVPAFHSLVGSAPSLALPSVNTGQFAESNRPPLLPRPPSQIGSTLSSGNTDYFGESNQPKPQPPPPPQLGSTLFSGKPDYFDESNRPKPPPPPPPITGSTLSSDNTDYFESSRPQQPSPPQTGSTLSPGNTDYFESSRPQQPSPSPPQTGSTLSPGNTDYFESSRPQQPPPPPPQTGPIPHPLSRYAMVNPPPPPPLAHIGSIPQSTVGVSQCQISNQAQPQLCIHSPTTYLGPMQAKIEQRQLLCNQEQQVNLNQTEFENVQMMLAELAIVEADLVQANAALATVPIPSYTVQPELYAAQFMASHIQQQYLQDYVHRVGLLPPPLVVQDSGFPQPGYQNPPVHLFPTEPPVDQCMEGEKRPISNISGSMEGEIRNELPNPVSSKNIPLTGAVPRRPQIQGSIGMQTQQNVPNLQQRQQRQQLQEQLQGQVQTPETPGPILVRSSIKVDFIHPTVSTSSPKKSSETEHHSMPPWLRRQSHCGNSSQAAASTLSPSAKEFYPRGYVPPEEDSVAENCQRIEQYTNQLLQSDDCFSDNSIMDNKFNLGGSPKDLSLKFIYNEEWSDTEMLEILALCQYQLARKPGTFSDLMVELRPTFQKWLQCKNTTDNLASFLFDLTLHSPLPFIYFSAKMCLYISRALPVNVFRERVIFRTESFYSNIVQLLEAEDTSSVYGFVLYVAELYIQLESQKNIRLMEFAIPLIGCLDQLLKKPKPKHIEAFVKAVKLAGIYLDEDMKDQMDILMRNAERTVGILSSVTDVSAIMSLIETRKNNWGRGGEPDSSDSSGFTFDDNAKEDKPNKLRREYNFPQTGGVYYGPDGQVMTVEEWNFLESHGATPFDQEGESNSEGGDSNSMDEEMQEAFEQFLLMVPDAR